MAMCSELKSVMMGILSIQIVVQIVVPTLSVGIDSLSQEKNVTMGTPQIAMHVSHHVICQHVVMGLFQRLVQCLMKKHLMMDDDYGMTDDCELLVSIH